MISGIVTMALALGASAAAADCDNDVTAIACRSFQRDADFQVEQVTESGNDQIYDIKSFLPYNRALMAVTTAPWDKLLDGDSNSDAFGQTGTDGCVFFESRSGKKMEISLTGSKKFVRGRERDQGDRHKCMADLQYGCNDKAQKDPADANAVEQEDKWAGRVIENRHGDLVAKGGRKGRDGLIHATNRVTLNHLVNGLNTLGAFDMYYHRVQANPIDGVDLKWIAENACKVSMPVSFQCTGSDCVEVQNIVCASFAGIDSKDFGVVSIECKVPPTKFHINSWAKKCRDSGSAWRDGDQGKLDGVTSNQAGGGGVQQTRQCLPQKGGIEYGVPNNKFDVTQDGGYMNIKGKNVIDFDLDTKGDFGKGAQQACSSGTCSITVKSKKRIPQDSNIEGSVSIHADVKSLNQVPRKWSEKLNHFHTAEFNLTRESAPEKVLEMPIGVNFYTDHCGQKELKNPHPSGDDNSLCKDRSTVGKVGALFSGGIDSVPFLSNQEVNLGQIKKNVHGYFRLVAKVDAKNTWFLKRAIDALEVSESGVDDGDFKEAGYKVTQCTSIEKKDRDTNTLSKSYKGQKNSDYHKGGFPVAYMVCPRIMVGKHAAAGNVLRFSISWQLASLVKNAAGYTGKAQLLQDAEEADPNAQSVEVQVTIQLGGGETNITTGTAEGAASADNTVTYIIIAVCVIAAALILAVVVVAFMCLRNRSQEQLVAMSPKQATVAAVYDISAPKKGDVMDV